MGSTNKERGSMTASDKIVELTNQVKEGELSQADLLYKVEMINRH